MPLFVNPFRRHNEANFPDVLVSLETTSRQFSSVSQDSNDTEKGINKSGGSCGDESPVDESPVDESLAIDRLRVEIDLDVATSGHDSVYDRKSKVINKAIQDIGMGRYNWALFVLCGFGWFADNFWLQGVALTLPSIAEEFGISDTKVRYTTCAVFTGLCVGASFWGVASDIIGRRVAFNSTLFLAGVFGTAVGGAQTWVAVCSLYALMGVGIGGNLPVDGALFLEFLPFSSGGLLTMLSLWWPVGQLLAALIAWALLPNLPSDKDWRYYLFTLGGITLVLFVCRFFLFHLFESPKYLLSRGRQAEAVATVHGLAYKNRRKTWLTEAILDEVGGRTEVAADAKLSTVEILKRSAGKFSTERIGPLFANRRLGMTTALLWFIWSTVGLAYPLFNSFLPQYLLQPINGRAQSEATPVSIVYRNLAITSIVGIPGSIIAWYTVDVRFIGRKGTMAVSTLISGVFIYLFTVAKSANYQLACTCVQAFFQNAMYGVLYAYTPEVFPAPNRGTGTGIASFLNRAAGLSAPIIAANISTSQPIMPIYVSGALFVASFIAMCLLPIETRGRQSL